ncbi:hypothetical protein C8N32_11013 [Rhodovulum imhoffii]|uniref:Uncharacterized protein n=1 Tax=Rhodovulum imhoffii TaxID=365340 RepID=A0A2T5BR48_9RHOB|nr:hypothetical protein C8N32_11013 [Rhodovulum imhoffii]
MIPDREKIRFSPRLRTHVAICENMTSKSRPRSKRGNFTKKVNEINMHLESWWATLESNQAWVSPAELQSAAAPCSTSP